ncbi:hypothetical protein ACFY1P_15945 [Streptomyces sp. NPDC001407]|uniref:hypothetical protein n=1 Tax=Streptomyces sp. NPDC001407 TaxID=3364573 RepID=UPI0036CDC1BB
MVQMTHRRRASKEGRDGGGAEIGSGATPRCTAPVAPDWVALQVRVRDTSTDRVGIIRGIGDPIRMSDDPPPDYVWLLPVGGGFEWPAAIGDLERHQEETPA